MTFFESLVALLLLAVVLLQVARRTWIPYPTMLATAGVIVALVPGSPAIALEGHTALALFIAPVLLDAAFDFPLAAVRKLWRQLIALAVVAVLLTTAVVAWIGWAFAGLPIAAAITLGAIVAPPDAAAATTVLRSAALPRRAVQELTGESLLNDATALLLFSAAVAVQSHGGIDSGVALRLGFAVPGGIALGLCFAWAFRYIIPYTRSSFGGNLLEFVNTFIAWLVAERLGLSAVLCVVTMAMFIANDPKMGINARNRVQSFAVWGVAVFVLNVLAFLLMGMQVREILGGMNGARLREAAGVAAMVVAAVIVTRIVWVLIYNRLAARLALLRGSAEPSSVAQALVVGWCGMRGLVTLATAFALPGDFPQRDLIVVSAFAVVLATLVVQGLTLTPLIRLLGLADGDDRREKIVAKRALADAALSAIGDAPGQVAEDMRRHFEIDRAALDGGEACEDFNARQQLKLKAIAAQRDRLDALRDQDAIGQEEYERLQEGLDWHELAIGPADQRTIEEG
ncbi:cation:proton antiporter [Sphingomonas psychrotolerans]|uniref:Cation:proton antiporter n=1 Tax=Sphingomonas psychrotolerans TaxID=1327635 RepID=A0ABU3N5R7_9SPHN|nr:cation:proton antiporter [Sphingomonas psychrotolerans]MDT8759882.1 cation:proton antiporter [Sphingomonas psychrotolerans]